MNETTDAAAIFAPLWKRKWLILIVALVVGAGSYFYYKRQHSVWSASTQVNLASGSEEQVSVNGGGGKASSISKAALANAGTIITSAVVAESAHKMLKAEHHNVKGKVRAKTSATGSDIVTITAESSSAKKAARLANAYALAYIKREHAAYVRSVRTAIANTRSQLRRIELASLAAARSKGSKGGSASNGTAVIQAASLSTKLNQLESQLSVQGIQQISPAKPKGAELVEPKPKQNGIFGFAFGLVLAAIGVFIAERFDRSLRSLAAVERVLGAPVLTALPRVRAPVLRGEGRTAPARPLVEPLRRLDSTLRLRESEYEPGDGTHVILLTSPNAGDGKSSALAALALVKREAGERVAVIEADFRRPVLAGLLGVRAEHGLADVLSGRRTLETAMQLVPGGGAVAAQGELHGEGSTLVQTRAETRAAGSVSLLGGGTGGEIPPSLDARAFTGLVTALSEDYDCVLIDAPSPLEVSEAMPLLRAADGILALVRLGHTRDVSAARLRELLELPSTAPVLGVVANDVPGRELKRTGFAAGGGKGLAARGRGRAGRSPIGR